MFRIINHQPAGIQMVVDKLEEEMDLRPALVVTALEALSNMPLTDPQQVQNPPIHHDVQ